MILTIKNKNLQAMRVLLEKSEKAQTIPKELLLDKKEFGVLLLELQAAYNLKIDVPVEITDIPIDNVYHSTALEIYRQPFTNESINTVIRRWIAEKFNITFSGVPIKYRAPKPNKNAEKWQG